MMWDDEPFTQADHDEAVEGFGRVLVLAVGLALGIAAIVLLG